MAEGIWQGEIRNGIVDFQRIVKYTGRADTIQVIGENCELVPKLS